MSSAPNLEMSEGLGDLTPHPRLEQFEFGGEMRVFGTLPDPSPSKTASQFRVFGEHGPDVTPPLILEKSWKPTWLIEGDNNDKYIIKNSVIPDAPGIGDQDGQGACGCISATEILELLMLKGGLPFKKLSWGQLYWSLNGGGDNGTYSGDVLKRLTNVGVCSVDTCPIDYRGRANWSQAQLADAQNYCIDEWFLCPTKQHLASALQQGFVLHSSIWWYGNDNVDQNGWLSDRPGGRKGGHSLRQTELIYENGKWGTRFSNTWTKQWGVNGFGKISLDRLASTLDVWPMFAARSIRQKDGNFPAPIKS